MDSVLYYFDHFSPEFLIIETGLLVVIVAIFIVMWVYNRKKFHALKHQIPAGVVKEYLDTIIQNSNALKSSLFRGGGVDVGSSLNIPMPSSSGAGGADPAMLLQRDSEIANLRSQLQEKNKIINSLEAKINPLEQENATLRKRIAELEAALKNAGQGVSAPVASAPAADSGDSAKLKAELSKVTKERDELLMRLKEYEIIEDDLANLKRLQQENEQLKKALGGGAPVAATPAAPAPASTPEVAKAAPAPEASAPAAVEVAEAVTASEDIPAPASGDAKSPEDLLSEFEKMLG